MSDAADEQTVKAPKRDRERTQKPSSEADHPPRSEDRKRRSRSPRGAAVTGEQDPVFLSRAEFQSRKTRKSLTVHHIQRRLHELGYPEAFADADGWYSDLTAESVRRFQEDQKIETARPGHMDAETFRELFELDDNVRVVIDA